MGGAATIRPMVDDDLPAVLAIDRAVGWPHEEARFRYLLADPETRGLVAEVAGRAVGFAFVGLRGPVGWLGALAVDPGHQGRGVGAALGRAADAHFRTSGGCDTAILEAYETNRRAIALYDRLGFVVTGVNDLCGTPRGEAPTLPAAGGPGDGVAREVAPLTEDDLPFLATLDDAYYGGWREQDLLYWLGQGPDLARLLWIDGQPAGYCLVERATGRIAPAAAPTLPDFLALLDAVLGALPAGPDAPPYAAHLRIADPDAATLTALAARNLHPVPTLRNVRMEKVYRRPLRRLAGVYASARPEKG